jgi:hypothetical protein
MVHSETDPHISEERGREILGPWDPGMALGPWDRYEIGSLYLAAEKGP